MRILVAFEEDYRACGDVIAYALRELRSHIEVSVAEGDELEAAIMRLKPRLVISNLAKKNMVVASDTPAWLELHFQHGVSYSGKLSLEGEDSDVGNPGLNELLRIVDEAERLLRMKGTLKPG